MSTFPGIGDTFGRYEIRRHLGRGGMGSVFEARQVDLGRAVALKVLNPEFAADRDFRIRFEREASILASLDSPHIIQVFDSGKHHDELFIATQLIQGRDLLRLLRDDGPLAAPMALKVVGQMASALADAHDAGVLHRDVKPGNVLLRESPSDVFAYLCDFGIARHRDATYTRTSGAIGTLSYMAPECHEGTTASVASDVYSLGCVLWAALTGQAPYERTSEYQVALAHVQEEIPVFVGDSSARSEINEILRRAMAKNPSARFRDAGEMHVALMAAEETARGLQSDVEGRTREASAQSDPTRIRAVPAQAQRPAQRGVEDTTGSARRRPAAAMAVAGAVVAALLAGGGIAAVVKLLGSEPASAAKPRADARSSMQSVFPSLDEACKEVEPNPINDEDQVFNCDYGEYVIRYSHWETQGGADEYLAQNYLEGGPSPWFINGAVAGSMWSALAENKDADFPYVWAAVYGDHPYTIILKAADLQAREAAKTKADAVTPDRVDAG